jgi:hypothetical protein
MMRINDKEMRRVKARIAFLGIRQNRMAADIGIGVTRLNRLLNGWLKATVEEKNQIKEYMRARDTAKRSRAAS